MGHTSPVTTPVSKETLAAGSSNNAGVETDASIVRNYAHDEKMVNLVISGVVQGLAALTDTIVKTTAASADADVARMKATVEVLVAVNATEKVLVEAVQAQERMFTAWLKYSAEETKASVEVIKDINARSVEALGMLVPVGLAAMAIRQAQVDIRIKTEERKMANSQERRQAQVVTPFTIPGGTISEKDGELHYTPSNGKA